VGGIVYAHLSPDTLVKASSITPSAYYSINGQFDVTVIPEFYISRRMYVYGYLSFGNYIDKFYGEGPESQEIADPDYQHDSFILEGHIQPQLDDVFRAGVFVRYFQRTVTDPQKNPFLKDPATIGSAGGQSTGLGLILSWDSRDNGFYPTEGSLNKIKIAYYDDALGSDFDYTRYEADLRVYRSLDATARHVLGLQGFGVLVTGAPPFYDLALMGGKTIMRGYYQGRYRDNVLIAGQAEYRFRLFDRFRIVGWMGTGQVAPSTEGIRMRALQYSYGFGFRYVFDVAEQLDIRADFGFGKGTNGAYFDVQQAF
jgi:outer membrane protein assembly factor BamA